MSLSTGAAPGPSRRAPAKASRTPFSSTHLLTVAQRDASGALAATATTGPSGDTHVGDATALRAAVLRQAELRRKGDKWADRLSEGCVGLDEFKRGARYLETHQYLAATHERHLSLLCSYPPCAGRSRAKWNPHQTARIVVRARAVLPTQGNAAEGFCSRACEVKSGYVLGQLGDGVLGRGKGGRWGCWRSRSKSGSVGQERGQAQAQRTGDMAGVRKVGEVGHAERNGGGLGLGGKQDGAGGVDGGGELRIVERPTIVGAIVRAPSSVASGGAGVSVPAHLSASPMTTTTTNHAPGITTSPTQTRSRLRLYSEPKSGSVPSHGHHSNSIASSSSTSRPPPAKPKPSPTARSSPAAAAAARAEYALDAPALSGPILAAARGARPLGPGDDASDDEEEKAREAARAAGWVGQMSFGPGDETDEVRGWFDEMRLGRELMQRNEEGANGR